MSFKKQIRLLALLLAFFSCTAVTHAHDAWVHPGRGPRWPVYYGHKVYERFPIAKIAALDAIDANGRKLAWTKEEDGDGVSIRVAKGTPAMFVLTYDNGYWVKGPGEGGNMSYMNVGRPQLDQGTAPLHPFKFAKTVLSWQPWMSKPVGQRVELVPLDFRGTPKAGGQLRLRLLFEGKPLADQMVENNSSEEGPRTDGDGYVTVTVAPGMNRFASDFALPKSDDPKADKVSLTAVLVFVAE